MVWRSVPPLYDFNLHFIKFRNTLTLSGQVETREALKFIHGQRKENDFLNKSSAKRAG